MIIGIQPLRIPAGWTVEYNLLPDVDPTNEYIDQFQGSSLLMLRHSYSNRMIDVFWRPEMDPTGSFKLIVYNCLEKFNPKNNTIEPDVDWEYPHLSFETKNKKELVQKLEEILITLKPFNDPRILKNRGVPDEPSETLRIQLETEGLNEEIFTRIIENGNAKIQSILIDHPDVNANMLQLLIEKGKKKGVKTKALQKLNSKKFRNAQ